MKIIYYGALLLLLWVPRIICIALTALGALVAGKNAWIMLLIGTAVLALSWKWPLIGGLLAIAAAIFYISGQYLDHNIPDNSVYIPVLLLGVLFLLTWFLKKHIRAAQDAWWEGT